MKINGGGGEEKGESRRIEGTNANEIERTTKRENYDADDGRWQKGDKADEEKRVQRSCERTKDSMGRVMESALLMGGGGGRGGKGAGQGDAKEREGGGEANWGGQGRRRMRRRGRKG